MPKGGLYFFGGLIEVGRRVCKQVIKKFIALNITFAGIKMAVLKKLTSNMIVNFFFQIWSPSFDYPFTDGVLVIESLIGHVYNGLSVNAGHISWPEIVSVNAGHITWPDSETVVMQATSTYVNIL